MIGQTLRHYRIESKLGEGGMGVVYKARDTHLDRPVAIKVLPPERVADPERKRRFVQEAKAASALNHPNILHIYDIDAADGVDYIAMEYVEGKTVDELIARKGMPVRDVLRYATQIAEALAAAHAAGIVHRDIKPGNVMVTGPASGHPGLVKILDFGLAKLTERDERDDGGSTQTVKRRTEEGAILGTLAYMSPEQAEGKKVDARSDIFSLGSVLYEMITGRPPFQGDTKMATLMAVIQKEPPPLTAGEVPPELERIVNRCLRKDPERRIQHMGDVKLALQELQEESESGRLVAAPPARQRSTAVLGAAAALLLATMAGIAWWILRPRAPRQGLELARVTADDGLTAYPALSPDGKLLAYASDRSGDGNLDIWVQQIGSGGAPLRLTRDEADESEPAFSPDGTRIAFRSERAGGGIYLGATLGGEPQRLVEQGRRPRFSPDGQWLAYWTGDAGVFSRNRMYIVPSNGGEPRQLASDFYSAYFPLWSPDGKHLLFMGARDPNISLADRYDWWVVSIDGGAAVSSGANALMRRHGFGSFRCPDPGDWFGDYVIFSSSTATAGEVDANLWQLRISPGSWRAQDAPERLTFGTGVEAQPSVGAGPNGGRRLVLASMTGNPDVWSLPLEPNHGKVLGEMRRLTSNIAVDNFPTVSADGRKTSFSSDRFKNADIYLKDLETGKETALTSTAVNEYFSIPSPDGSRVAYYSERATGPGFFFYVVSSSGGTPKKVCENCDGPFVDWSPDQSRLIRRTRGPGGLDFLVFRDLERGQETPFLKHSKYSVTAAKLSPDGRWAAFQTAIDQTRRQIFVAPVRDWTAPGETEWVPITDGSGRDLNAVWSPDGNVLYFFSERDGFRCFWAQRLEPASKRPDGAAFAVQHFHQARRSLLPFAEVRAIGLSVGRDKLVFSMAERTGNIWMTELPAQR